MSQCPTISSQQKYVLRHASFDRPIYAAPAPGFIEAERAKFFCAPRGTVRALVGKGFLIEDGEQGFLLTDAGYEYLRRRRT